MSRIPFLATTARTMTARQIIERRLGRPLGPIATMPADLRRAMYLLALQLVKPGARPLRAYVRKGICRE
jgi:hypothetical protein